MNTLCRMKFMLILLIVPLIALGAGQSTLIDKVRNSTEPFKDINVAIAVGFVQGTPCVRSPDGAMHIHFVLPTLLTQSIASSALSADLLPQALIYEARSNGSARLVGAEYIVLASAWTSQHPGANQPALEGQPLSLVNANRYRRDDYRRSLGAFYELPVMAWEQNPVESFAKNAEFSCAQQPSQI